MCGASAGRKNGPVRPGLSPEGRAVAFNACYSGPAREAERVFAKVRAAAGAPLRDTLRTIDYVAVPRSGDVDDPRAVGS